MMVNKGAPFLVPVSVRAQFDHVCVREKYHRAQAYSSTGQRNEQ